MCEWRSLCKKVKYAPHHVSSLSACWRTLEPSNRRWSTFDVHVGYNRTLAYSVRFIMKLWQVIKVASPHSSRPNLFPAASNTILQPAEARLANQTLPSRIPDLRAIANKKRGIYDCESIFVWMSIEQCSATQGQTTCFEAEALLWLVQILVIGKQSSGYLSCFIAESI